MRVVGIPRPCQLGTGPDVATSVLDRGGLVRVGQYAWALLGLVGLGIVLWIAVSYLAIVVVPLLLALFPAAAVTPAMSWLADRRIPRALAALLLVLGVLAVLGGMIAAIIPSFLAQLPELVGSVTRAVNQLEPLVHQLPGVPDDVSLGELVRQAVGGAGGVGGAVSVGRMALKFLSGLVLLLVALYFYLYYGMRVGHGLTALAGQRRRAMLFEVGSRVWHTIGWFFGGQTLVALVDAVLIGTGLAILGVPLVLPLGVLVFLGGYLPYIGATVSGLLAVLVAFADGGLQQALIAAAIVLAVQQLEGNLIQPLIMGRMVRVPAFVVIVGIAVGATLLGVLGAFLAVPVAASAARVVTYLRELKQPDDERGEPEAEQAGDG